MKSLLGIKGLGSDQLSDLIGLGVQIAQQGRSTDDSMRGLTVGTLFFENSTRTRLSFELAAQKLGAQTMTFVPEHSSMSKGETLRDTVLTVAAIGADILIVRHREEGVPGQVEEWTGRPVVNGGDGTNEHPTQAIADCVTLVNRFGSIEGLNIAIVGDVVHSRVAGSLIQALPMMGAEVTLVGPGEFLPQPGETDLDAVVGKADVVYLLRVQRERGADVDPDYTERYQLTEARAARMHPEAVVMHPGPMNRGLEIADQVADGPRSLILDQVANGVPARMAVLSRIAEGIG